MIFGIGFCAWLVGYVCHRLSTFDEESQLLFWLVKVVGILMMAGSLLILAWRHLP